MTRAYVFVWQGAADGGNTMHRAGCADIARDVRRGGNAETITADTWQAAVFDAIRGAYPDPGEIPDERIRSDIATGDAWAVVKPCAKG